MIKPRIIVTGSTGKSFLEAWWLRKFPANPLKWGSVLSLADAEELLMEFRISTEATLSPDEEHYEMVSSPEEKTSRGSYTSEGRKAGARKAAQARWAKKKRLSIMTEQIIRCPYCVVGDQFKPMLSRGGGVLVCSKCGHTAIHEKPEFQCSCQKCGELNRTA